ncbi:MAG TPA: 4'-phosphopantetheinyl transferase superfamily protein [Pyrinomonadaceae bacterium]
MSTTIAGTAFDCWNAPPPLPVLRRKQVHVWRAALEQPSAVIDVLWDTLAVDERERAERFHFRRDREHYIVARGVLRNIIGRYSGIRPGALRFRYGSHGKPALAVELNEARINFNVSHSHNLALFAITRERELGIDIEYVRAEFAQGRVAEQFFSRREVATLRALPADAQAVAFFNCWTRKEAYVKAKGEGLSMPLDRFDVSLVPGEAAALLTTRGDAREASRWALQELMPAPGFVAAIAVEGHEWELECWQWQE